jgi:hypothetical protein
MDGSSPDFPSNLGMSDWRFIGMDGHEGSWRKVSIVKHDISRKYNVTNKGQNV